MSLRQLIVPGPRALRPRDGCFAAASDEVELYCHIRNFLILRSGHRPRLEGRMTFVQATKPVRFSARFCARPCRRGRALSRPPATSPTRLRPLVDRQRGRRPWLRTRAASGSTASASTCSTAVIRSARRTARSGIPGARSPRRSRLGAARQGLLAVGFNTPAAGRCPAAKLALPAIIDLELGRRARFHWFDPFAPDIEGRMMAIAREWSRPTAVRRTGSAISRTTRSAGGPARCSSSTRRSRPTIPPSSAGWRCCARHYGDDWGRFAADFMPPAGVARGMRCCATHPHAARRARHRRRARMDRPRRRALLRARRKGDPRRRPRRAVFRRPSADLLRPGRGAGDGAACRRDRDELQRRQRRRLDRALFLRRAGKLSGGKPVLVSEWFFAARRTAPATATTAT